MNVQSSRTHEGVRHSEESVTVFGLPTGAKQFVGKCEHVKHSTKGSTEINFDTRYPDDAVIVTRAPTGVKQFLKKCEHAKYN